MESVISETQVERWVRDTILEDPELNLSLVPDSVEVKLYTKCVARILRTFAAVTETFKVEFLGHNATIHFSPSDSKLEEKDA